jgi:hypothetical protein
MKKSEVVSLGRQNITLNGKSINEVKNFNEVQRRQLNWIGHAFRSNKGEPMRTFALYEPAHGKMKRGKPEISYMHYISRLLGTRNIEVRSAAEIESLAHDRKKWRIIANKSPCAWHSKKKNYRIEFPWAKLESYPFHST